MSDRQLCCPGVFLGQYHWGTCYHACHRRHPQPFEFHMIRDSPLLQREEPTSGWTNIEELSE